MCRVALRRPSSVQSNPQDMRHEQDDQLDVERAQRFVALLTHLAADDQKRNGVTGTAKDGRDLVGGVLVGA